MVDRSSRSIKSIYCFLLLTAYLTCPQEYTPHAANTTSRKYRRRAQHQNKDQSTKTETNYLKKYSQNTLQPFFCKCLLMEFESAWTLRLLQWASAPPPPPACVTPAPFNYTRSLDLSFSNEQIQSDAQAYTARLRLPSPVQVQIDTGRLHILTRLLRS